MPKVTGPVTTLLAALRQGDSTVEDQLFELVYDELRRLAGGFMRGERRNHTLQATALVHEAYVRLIPHKLSIQDRHHLLALAATAMRRLLIDYARASRAGKRGGDETVVSFDDKDDHVATLEHEPAGRWALTAAELIAMDDALTALAAGYPRHARVVELRHFGGLPSAEIAAVLSIARRTVDRDWDFAIPWLKRHMDGV
jgi:RNA polymerase sigma factor (TIGR02999 family)